MTVSKPTATELADRLRNDILTGRIQPGCRLVEQEISQRFGVGRGRVREAIQQLARQGLLLMRANRGAVVAVDAPKAIRDLIIPIRRTVELYALNLVFDSLNEEAFRRWDAILARMHDACVQHDLHTVAETDLEFHRTLIDLAGEPDLMVIWETLVGRIHSHFLQVQWRQTRLLDIYDEHRQLVEVFRSGDRDAAYQLLSNRIN
ncbi:MAG: GntR family transcriptional regulator [Bacteroidales bacterium]|nr:GntR family transcriptional regulator [Bacteroidales bacterium]